MVKRGRETAKVQLSQRFQEAVDRAAMRAGKGSSDAYLADWQRNARPCGDDLQAEANAEAAANSGTAYIRTPGQSQFFTRGQSSRTLIFKSRQR